MFVFGWRNDPAAVQKVLATLPMPFFASSASHLKGTGEKKTVLLYKAYKDIFGSHMPAQRQPKGTCTSRGYSRAANTLQCVQIKQGASLEYKPVSHSAIYGMSRQYGNDLSWQDGSVGAWLAAVCTDPKGGFVPQEFTKSKYDPRENYTDDYSDDLAAKWAAKGVPQEVWDKAKESPVKTVSLVDKADEIRDAICNGYPVPVCSNQGFTMKRDSKGRCTPSGTWNHCMLIDAYDADLNRFCIQQSWGQNVPEGPLYLDQPDNSFWVDYDVIDRMARQGDTFALSNYVGFPAQTLDWYI